MSVKTVTKYNAAPSTSQWSCTWPALYLDSSLMRTMSFLAHVAKGLCLATWAVLTSCSPSKQKLASYVLLSCLDALLPSTRPTSKQNADGLLNWPKWWEVTSLSKDLLEPAVMPRNSEQYLFAALCFLSKQKQFSMFLYFWRWEGKCSIQWNLGVILSKPNSVDIILKHFSTDVSIIAGGTATLGADLIRSITSTSARNAVQAPAQIGCILRSTVWVNKARTDTKLSKSLACALMCPACLCLCSYPLWISHEGVLNEIFLGHTNFDM